MNIKLLNLIKGRKNRVVFGVSGVGKSTYIEHLLKSDDAHRRVKLLMAYEVEGRESIAGRDPCIIHYNALRPYNNNFENYADPIERDQVADLVFDRRRTSQVDILVARPSTIAKRVLLREEIEPVFRGGGGAYPYQDIYEFISRVDLLELHRRWISYFKEEVYRFDMSPQRMLVGGRFYRSTTRGRSFAQQSLPYILILKGGVSSVDFPFPTKVRMEEAVVPLAKPSVLF